MNVSVSHGCECEDEGITSEMSVNFYKTTRCNIPVFSIVEHELNMFSNMEQRCFAISINQGFQQF